MGCPAPRPDPGADAFQQIQQDIAWKVDKATTLRAGAAWQRHDAAGWIPGAARNGFRYFAELAFRWTR